MASPGLAWLDVTWQAGGRIGSAPSAGERGARAKCQHSLWLPGRMRNMRKCA